MSDLIFNNTATAKELTMQELKNKVPYAFLSTPSRAVSDKYIHLPTSRVVEDLSKLGWVPVEAKQTATKQGKKSNYSKHMIAFRNPDIMIKGKNGDDAFPQIILTNSHDGLSSFKFMVGIYRMVCSNGLVVADEEFANFNIRHRGYTFEELQTVVAQVVEEVPRKVEVMNKMNAKELTKAEQETLALNALLLRKGIKLGSEEAKGIEYDQDTLDEILEVTRPADEGDNLWVVFNRVQEKLIKGGFSAALRGSKVRKVKSIKSFQTDIKLNQELFKLATSMVA
tara:strand:+ start:10385 stop:11230 length:846 start_codon:yes stop_codon:yes gene_type:complete